MLHKPIKKAWLLYLCLLTLMAGCSQCNKVISPNDASSLPPTTQTGAGTFGCMLNGQVWTPQGRGPILEPRNPSINYDATYEGGALALTATIYDKSVNGQLKQTISIGGLNVGSIGEYNLTNSRVRFFHADYVNEIEYAFDTDIASNCRLIITKLDKVNQIIAGTFSFTIEKKDTGKKVTITDGRFDMKYL